MYVHACKIGLEGVVSKIADSRYHSGRSRDWVKKTCAQRETPTIAGFALDGNDWNGIYLGRRKGKDLIYAGGFDKASASEACGRICDEVRCEGCHFIWKAHSDWPWLGAHPADDPRKERIGDGSFRNATGFEFQNFADGRLRKVA